MRTISLICGVLCTVLAPAQVPQVDLAYGDSGIAWTGDSTHSMSQRASAMGPDGSVVVGGFSYPSSIPQSTYDRAMVARFLPDGSLDQNFGMNGLQRPGNGPHNANMLAIGVNSYGTILCGMHIQTISPSLHRSAVVAMHPDGSLDTTFADSGQFIAPASVPGSNTAGVDHLVVLADDKILIHTTSGGAGLWRLTVDGTLDTTFGNNGYVDLYLLTGHNRVIGLHIDGSGMILVLTTSTSAGAITLTRLAPSGQLDVSFGNNGKLVVPNTDDVSTSNIDMAVWPSGETIITLNDSELDEFRLLKYTSTGQLDTGFAAGGIRTIPYLQGKTIGGIFATSISPNGQVMIVLNSYNGNNDPSIREIHRMHADGSIDPTFGTNGIYALSGNNTWYDKYVVSALSLPSIW